MVYAYWWKGHLNSDGTVAREIPNWGDRLNWLLLRSLGLDVAWRPPGEADVVLIGSVLEHLPPKWAGTVLGAGKLHEDSELDLSWAEVVAVRGKLTAAAVGGDPVLGDPALLMPRFIRQWPAKYELGVLPHWSDTELVSRFPHAHVIDPTWRPEKVVEHIVKCRRLVTSSLHGAVIADAYGIPRQAERLNAGPHEGGDFKWRDFSSIYDTHPHFGEMWLAPHDVVARVQADLLAAIRAELGLGRQVVEAPPSPPPARRRRCCCRRKRRPLISILVPFRDDGEERRRTWDWLKQYWEWALPDAEVIEGHTDAVPFNKAAAVNDAACRANGKVFVILDADIYTDWEELLRCARALVSSKQRRWFMPYDKFYRLNAEATSALLAGDPAAPYQLPSPPPADELEPGCSADYGTQYGAGVLVMPREAFYCVGGFDPRFSRGWGSEDASMLRALDTLWAPHEVVPNDVVHLWHMRPGTDWKTRTWVGQAGGSANSRLAQRYAYATGEPGWMRSLCDEHPLPCAPKPRRCPLRRLGPWGVVAALVAGFLLGQLGDKDQATPPPPAPVTSTVTAPPVTAPPVTTTVTVPAPPPSENPPPPSTPPAPPGPKQKTHEVKPGESLWKISERYYGHGRFYRKLSVANNLPQPGLIYPGQVLVIPD